MAYRLLADLVVALHLAFIAFAAAGGLLTLRWRAVAWAHGPAVAWAATVALAGWICPLTPLENTLRRAAGQAGYTGSFLEQHVLPVLYPAGLTRELQLALGAGIIVLNIAIYAVVWRRRPSSD